MLTKVTHDHRDAERSWRPHAKNAYNSPLEIEILKSVLGSRSGSHAKLCSSLWPEHTLALPAELCFSLGLEHKWRSQVQIQSDAASEEPKTMLLAKEIATFVKRGATSQRRAHVNDHEAVDA